MAGPHQAKAGDKRKRDTGRPAAAYKPGWKGKGKQRAGQDEQSADKASLAGKLHHSLQVIVRAAKKARTFEIQKLVRKIKSDKAKGDAEPGTSKLHAELDEILTALKDLELDSLAAHSLSAKLHKDKSGLADVPEVQTFASSLSPLTIDATSIIGKAQNRVLANKVLVQAVAETLEQLRQKSGISAAFGASAKKASPSVKDDTNAKSEAGTKVPAATSEKASKGKSRRTPKLIDGDGDTTSSEEDEDDSGSSDIASHISAEEDMPDDEFEGSTKKRASSSEDEDDAEDNDSHDDESISGASTSSFPALKAAKTKEGKKRKAIDRSPPTTSAFLPSLAAGYTLGDSDGSVYSDDDDVADTKPERKNRRGQRARRMIWERKYGKDAKHIVKAQSRDKETEEARAKARAEKEVEALKRSGRYVYGLDTNLTAPTEGKAIRKWAAAAPEGTTASYDALPVKAKPLPASNAIHPSWEARKKAKEAQASLASAKPAGKKILFD